MNIEHSIKYSACRMYSTANNTDFTKRFPLKYHKQTTVTGYLLSRQAEFTLKEIQVT